MALWFLRSKSAHIAMPVYQGRTAEQWLGQIVFSTNREAALKAFRKMGVKATPMLLQAFEKVDSPWDEFWQWAYPKLPVFLRPRLSLPLPAFAIRGLAMQILWDFRDSAHLKEATFPELLRHLQDKSKSDQAHAYVMGVLLQYANKDSASAVPVVVPYLQDNDPKMRRAAASVLEIIGPPAKAAMPGLTVALNDADVSVRVHAARAVWRIDQQTNVAAAVLEKELASMAVGDFFVCITEDLSRVSPQSSALLPAYIKALQAPKATYPHISRDHDFRSDFIVRLAEYGRAAEAAAPALVRIIREEPSLRATALQTLRQIDPEEAKKWDTAASSSQ